MPPHELRQLLDRLVALLDHCDDIDALLPDSPYSMSSNQLRIATLTAHIRNELPEMLAGVREAMR